MKHRIAAGFSIGITAIIFLACNAKKEETAAVVIDKDQIKNEIQAKEDSFASVYNSGELRSIGYYADDATSYFQNREPLIGKDSILAFLRSDLAENTNR